MRPRISPDFSAQFWIGHLVVPLLLFFGAATLFEVSEFDLVFSDYFFDFSSMQWRYGQSWWANDLIHEAGRDLILYLGLAGVAVCLLSFRLVRLRPWRRAALFFCLCIALGTGIVALGKQIINRHCPWDYERYGGSVPYTRLFEAPPACGGEVGNCFPAGHASGGFAMMGVYFILVGRNRRLAMAALLLGIGLGTVFGFGQLVRGAHFFSHNLWTAVICWFSSLLLYVFVFGGRVWPPASR